MPVNHSPGTPAIQVTNLGKRYRIGAPQAPYRTLRDVITEGLKAPMQRLRRVHTSSEGSRPPTSNTIWALRNVSLEIPQGEILGIIGRNGAGKTTLLKVLSRITEPTEGRVMLNGRLGSLLEVGTGFHPELTGRENIFLNGAILGMSHREIKGRFDEIVAFAEIEPFLDTPLKHYSTGMGTRLAFAVAAHLDTDILLVDEVLAVGDLGFRQKCLGKMQDVTRLGRTVLFVSHDLLAIRRLCRCAIWLDQGRVMATGGVQEVVAKYEASFLDPESRGAARVERSQPPASPKYFSWASLATVSGDPATTFNFGDTLRLTLGMTGRSPTGNHHVEWFLHDLDQGNRVAFGTTHATQEGGIPADTPEISFIIGPLPLSKGNYSFSFTMPVPNIVNLDYWHRAITLAITATDFHGTGYSYTTRYAPVIIPYSLGSF